VTSVAAWLDMMRQTVTVEPVSGRDLFGNKTYGAALTYRCRLVGKRKLVIDEAGKEVLSRQTVYLATADAIDPESRVTLSTADVGSTAATAINPPIVSTARFPDETGWHHAVIYLG
jgi:hypothetical protein